MTEGSRGGNQMKVPSWVVRKEREGRKELKERTHMGIEPSPFTLCPSESYFLSPSPSLFSRKILVIDGISNFIVKLYKTM